MLFEIARTVGGMVAGVGATKLTETVIDGFLTEELAGQLIIKIGKFAVAGAVGVAGTAYAYQLFDEAKAVVETTAEAFHNMREEKRQKKEESKGINWQKFVEESQGES